MCVPTAALFKGGLGLWRQGALGACLPLLLFVVSRQAGTGRGCMGEWLWGRLTCTHAEAVGLDCTAVYCTALLQGAGWGGAVNAACGLRKCGACRLWRLRGCCSVVVCLRADCCSGFS